MDSFSRFFLFFSPLLSQQKKAELIDLSKHLVLRAPHPSPLSASRGFFGCKHFSQANKYLVGKGKTAIDWNDLDS